MDFENLTSEDLIKKPPKAVKKKKVVHTGIAIKIGNVTLYYPKPEVVPELGIVEGMSLEGLLQLQNEEGIVPTSVDPPMYSIFKTVDGKLQTYVAVGDRVRYAKAIYMPSGVVMTDEFTVTNVELSSLGNMSVFVAALDNGDTTVLTNFLKKV